MFEIYKWIYWIIFNQDFLCMICIIILHNLTKFINRQTKLIRIINRSNKLIHSTKIFFEKRVHSKLINQINQLNQVISKYDSVCKINQKNPKNINKLNNTNKLINMSNCSIDVLFIILQIQKIR